MTQSKSKNDLITLIVNSKSINATLNKVTADYRDEFRSFFYLTIAEKSEEELFAAYDRSPGSLERYAGAIIRNQLKSNQSPFQYKRLKERNTYQNIDNISGLADDETSPEKIQLIEEINYQRILSYLNHIHPKKSQLFIEHYINCKSIMEISKQYGIKYRTVHASIRKTEQLIRDNLKFQNE